MTITAYYMTIYCNCFLSFIIIISLIFSLQKNMEQLLVCLYWFMKLFKEIVPRQTHNN